MRIWLHAEDQGSLQDFPRVSPGGAGAGQPSGAVAHPF